MYEVEDPQCLHCVSRDGYIITLSSITICFLRLVESLNPIPPKFNTNATNQIDTQPISPAFFLVWGGQSGWIFLAYMDLILHRRNRWQNIFEKNEKKVTCFDHSLRVFFPIFYLI